MIKNAVIKSFVTSTFICVFYCFNCFGQAPGITYHTPNNFTVNSPISALAPTITDGKITYTINPKLPDGLQIAPNTGVISGTPCKPSPTADYTVIARGKNDSVKSPPIKITIVEAGKKDTSSDTQAKADCCKVSNDARLCFGEWVLVFMPVFLFLIFLFFFLKYINSTTLGKEFNLKEALSENDYNQIIVNNPQYNNLTSVQLIALQTASVAAGAGPGINFFPTTITTTDDKYRPSISRLIAFLTSMLSLVIGLGLSCFFIYCYLKSGCIPDVGKLTGVLISMGIGVVPYAFNKVSGMGSKS